MTEREKVIKELQGLSGSKETMKLISDVIELLKEQKHGHWIFDPNGMDWNIPAWRCSECACLNNNIPPNIEKVNPLRWSGSKYCPNCGAKMAR